MRIGGLFWKDGGGMVQGWWKDCRFDLRRKIYGGCKLYNSEFLMKAKVKDPSIKNSHFSHDTKSQYCH